jgi:hypothetical protein
MKRHIVVPDTQCKPGVPLEHLTWAGKYIAEMRPDTVVHLGDHWDFPSLSSYDEDKPLLTEGQDFEQDIQAGNRGLEMLSKPFAKLKCRRVLLRGNHEDRMERERQKSPRKLRSLFSESRFNDKALGWQVVPYRKPIDLDGILYCHYFYNPRSGRPYTGTAASILRQVGQSFIQGHRQSLDPSGIQELPGGGRRRGIIAGSFYQHDEQYLGPQGDHWRGILVLNEVRNGNFDLMEVSLDYLRRKYGRAR